MSIKNHSAPGPAGGYIFQFERALYWLAKSPAKFVIGIETEDDVVIRHKDGSLSVEQDKHSIQENAKPFGDRSKDLWNTLSIWVSALEAGELEVGKTRFLMVTNKALSNCIARQISNSQSEETIDECINALQQAAVDPSKTILAFTQKVLLPSSRKHLKGVIANCELLDESDGASGVKLREATIGELQIPDGYTTDAESITNELLGWLYQQVLVLWQKGEPARVSRDSFVTQFHAVLDRRKRQLTRERAANLIPVFDEQLGHEKGRDFVKQIYLVTDEDWRVEESIRHFIRCKIEKTDFQLKAISLTKIGLILKIL